MTTTPATTQKNRSRIPIAVAIAVITATAATLYASPYWALHSLSNAVRDRDAARVSEYVDFVLLRDSVKELLAARMDAEMQTRGVAADENPFANLAQTFVKGMLNQAVDAMVSPSGVVRLLQQQQQLERSEAPRSGSTNSSNSNTSGQASKPRFHVDYQNYSTVHVRSEGREVGFIFRRYGLLSWKMVGLNGSLPDPQTGLR